MLDKITKCRGCRSSKITEVLPLQSIPIGTHFSREPNQELVYPIGLTLCEKCSLVQLTQEIHRPTVFRQGCSNISTSLLYPGKIEFQAFEWPVLPTVSNRALVLDLGGPTCSFGYEAAATVDERSAKGVSKSDEDVVCVNGATCVLSQFDEETVSNFVDHYGQVDKVRVDNSNKKQHPLHLSNVDDPFVYVRNLNNLVKPGGTVVVRTPYLGAIVREGYFDYVYHEHQSYFSLISIKNLFSSLGFKIVDAYMCENDNLNAQFVFTKGDFVASDSPTLNQFIKMEEPLNLDKSSTYVRVGTNLKSLQDKVQQDLKNIKATAIVGYGASVAPVSMMYQYKIVDYLDFLVDDDKEKIGLFCPGANLLVRNPARLYLDNVDVVVLLASRFSNAILQKHSQFTGKILIPTLNWSCSV